MRCRNLLSSDLTADDLTHQSRFQLLLQLEEIQMEVDIRKYDLVDVQLGRYNTNRRLLTLEVENCAFSYLASPYGEGMLPYR